MATPIPHVSIDFGHMDADRGWRTETVRLPNGDRIERSIPLTSEEFLHPKEGYHLPTSTIHEDIIAILRDILVRRYQNDPSTAVFSDLLINWQRPDMKDHAPDICVIFNVRDRETARTEFRVNDEGTMPSLIIEVVSPHYRKEDREIKVRHYETVGVPEYVIFDRRRQRGRVMDEVLGHRLVNGLYVPIVPDNDGMILATTVGVRFGWQSGKIRLVDAQTGDRLLNSAELAQRMAETEKRVIQAEDRATQAEDRAARFAELLRSQGIDPDSI